MSEDKSSVESGSSEEPQNEVLPDWAREQITKANNQAAKYRTEKNEAVESAKAEVAADFQKRVEELEAKIAEKEDEVGSSRYEVDRLKVAIQAGIDSSKVISFAELLKGETSEELVSHAEELKKLFTTEEQPKLASKATDPSQGSGNSLPLNGDPLLAAVTRAVNR